MVANGVGASSSSVGYVILIVGVSFSTVLGGGMRIVGRGTR